MPVLEQHDQRCSLREHDEERGQCLHERRLQVLTLQVAGDRMRLAVDGQEMKIERHERLEGSVDLADPRYELQRVDHAPDREAKDATHDLDERTVRRDVTERPASALQRPDVPGQYAFSKLVEKPALTNPRLADDLNHAAGAVICLLDATLEQREVARATDIRRQAELLRSLEARLQTRLPGDPEGRDGGSARLEDDSGAG